MVTRVFEKRLCIVITDYNTKIQYGREGEVMAD